MKKRMTLGMFIVILILPALCLAAYRIELKDGSSFVTDRYWEKGSQIRYNQYGGVLGVAKDQVKSITETDAEVPAEVKRSYSEPAENIPAWKKPQKQQNDMPEMEKSTQQEAGKSKTENETSSAEKEESFAFQNKVKKLQEQLQQVHQEIVKNVKLYYAAMDKEDQFTMDNKRGLINELKAEKQSIKEKVLELYDDSLPNWWFDIVNNN